MTVPTMEFTVALGHTNMATCSSCQTAVRDCIGLTSELCTWLFLHFNEHCFNVQM